MGMYDTLVVMCPKCYYHHSLQSKAGPCDLTEYTTDNVPPSVAGSISGERVHCTCGSDLLVKATIEIEVVILKDGVDPNEDLDADEPKWVRQWRET